MLTTTLGELVAAASELSNLMAPEPETAARLTAATVARAVLEGGNLRAARLLGLLPDEHEPEGDGG